MINEKDITEENVPIEIIIRPSYIKYITYARQRERERESRRTIQQINLISHEKSYLYIESAELNIRADEFLYSRYTRQSRPLSVQQLHEKCIPRIH